MKRFDELPEHIKEKISIKESGCWEWVGSITGGGYGRVHVKSVGGMVVSHKVVYEMLVGPVPDGLELDHLCRNRACANPDHLEPVTRLENILRGVNQVARNIKSTHCIHGHEFTPENTIVDKKGHRNCRTCRDTVYPSTRR